MKIAMFGHKSIPSRLGGVEQVVEEVSRRMVSLGHSVTCYNRGAAARADAKDAQCCQGIVLRRVWTINRKGLAAVSSSFFAALCSSFGDAEVVHIHAEGPAFWCWLPKLFGKRVVVTVHGLDWQREKWKGSIGAAFIRAGERMAVRYADKVIVLSRNVQAYFQNTYGRETVYIPNGVTPLPYMPPRTISERFGLEKNGYILFLGRLVPEKGIHYLLKAFRNVQTDKKLVIAGAASDSQDYVRRLKAMAEGDRRVLFTGFVQGQMLEELYSNAYVYVLPSDLEGMPLSLLEAMSSGNCCLVSDIPECAEVVQTYGVRFPKGNVSELAKTLQTLCAEPETVAHFQPIARDYVCKAYSWEETVQKTLEQYR